MRRARLADSVIEAPTAKGDGMHRSSSLSLSLCPPSYLHVPYYVNVLESLNILDTGSPFAHSACRSFCHDIRTLDLIDIRRPPSPFSRPLPTRR